MKLRFTPVARDDLENIWEYIAEENPPAATRPCGADANAEVRDVGG